MRIDLQSALGMEEGPRNLDGEIRWCECLLCSELSSVMVFGAAGTKRINAGQGVL